MKPYLLLLAVCATITSCQLDTSDVLPSSNGRIYEVMVVMAKEKWESESGRLLDSVLTADIPALNSPEALFDVISIPFTALKNVTRNHRNLMLVKIGTDQASNEIRFQKEVYASPQVVIHISAKSPEDFKKLVEKNQQKLVDFLLEAEQERTIRNFRRLMENPIVERIEKSKGISLSIPKGFRLNKDSLGFIWVSQETQETSLGLFIYSRPYRLEKDFEESSMLQVRDSLLRKHVPGPRKGSFMTTERDYALHFRKFEKEGRFFSEIRGLWKLHGDFMGGPFISLSTLDASKTMIITMEAYVYAPNKAKRNSVRQLESILQTSALITQPDHE